MRIERLQSIAVLVDVQERLFPHMHEAEHLEGQLSRLLRGFAVLEIPVIVTQQYTRGLGPTIAPLLKLLPSADPVEKLSFSCCDEPQFMARLQGTGLGGSRVILAGIETHVCILQTTLDLLGAGYTPVVIADAVSSRSVIDREVALARMRQEGAIISTVESILFELTRLAGTPLFREISAIVK